MTKPKNIIIAVCALMACGAAVRCSAWLGGGSFDWYRFVRLCLFQGALVLEMWLIWDMGKFLYDERNREHGKHHGKDNQPHGQLSDCDGVSLHLVGGNLSTLRKRGLQLGNMLLHPKRIAFGFDRRPKCVNAFLNLFGIEHTCVSPPNDPSSATDAPADGG